MLRAIANGVAKMNLNSYQSYDSLVEKAAACGIDFSGMLSLEPGDYKDPPVISKKYKKRSAYWVKHFTRRDGTTGVCVTMHTHCNGGHTETWVSGLDEKPYQPNPKKIQARLSREKSDAEKRKRAWETARLAWQAAPLTESCEYLANKGFSDANPDKNLRTIDAQALNSKEKPGLKLPCLDIRNINGKFIGVQRLYPDGQKKFTKALAEGDYKGAFHTIGKIEHVENPEAEDFVPQTVAIGEGYASVRSVRDATGWTVVAAMSADNLDHVCADLVKKYPHTNFVIVADNDPKPEADKGNAGLFKAFEAARKYNLPVTYPRSDTPQDFNDLHKECGLEAVRQQLETFEKPKKNLSDHILSILPWAYRHQRASLISRLAKAMKVPFRVSEANLIEILRATLGPKFDEKQARKAIASAIFSEKISALKYSSILPKNVDVALEFKTVRNELGHLVIPDAAVDAALSHLADGSGVIMLSPMGTRKTEGVIKTAMDQTTGRAAIVLPRISVSKDAASRLRFSHYGSVDCYEIQWTERLVSVINSVGAQRFRSRENGQTWFDGLDLLCLDEASQLIPQITQLGSAQRKKLNYDSLASSIRTAKSLLIADAGANEHMLERLRKIDPTRKFVLINVRHDPEEIRRKNFSVTDSAKHVHLEIIRHVSLGGTALVATDVKRQAKMLEEAILCERPDARVLAIHAEPTADSKVLIDRFYDDPNGEAKKYDAIIYSPAITSGVSISEPHFSGHFATFSGVIKPMDAIQMLGRDRTAQKWIVAISSRKIFSVPSFDAAMALADFAETLTEFGDLKYANDLYEARARENFDTKFLHILHNDGHRISWYEAPDVKKSRKIDEAYEAIKRRKYDMIASQGEVTEEEFIQLSRIWAPTDVESARVTAYRIKNEMCAAITDEAMDFYFRGGLRKLNLFECTFSNENLAEKFDRKQAFEGIDPSLRYYAAEKHKMLQETISLLGVRDNIRTEFTHTECERVVDLFLRQHSRANLLFGSVIDPKRPPKCATTFVINLLARLGLKIGMRKTNGRKRRFIDMASWNFVSSLACERDMRNVGLYAPLATEP
jgi:phage/plasmid primase-like uncharacterized protein